MRAIRTTHYPPVFARHSYPTGQSWYRRCNMLNVSELQNELACHYTEVERAPIACLNPAPSIGVRAVCSLTVILPPTSPHPLSAERGDATQHGCCYRLVIAKCDRTDDWTFANAIR